MVNMKAGAHQGQHKRNLAAGDAASNVSKAEKMKLRADATCVNANGVALRVVAREKTIDVEQNLFGERNAFIKAALVAPETLAALAVAAGTGVEKTGGGDGSGSTLLLCRPGGDFILSARAAPETVDIEPGAVLLGEAQRLSLHVCEDESCARGDESNRNSRSVRTSPCLASRCLQRSCARQNQSKHRHALQAKSLHHQPLQSTPLATLAAAVPSLD